MIRIVVDSTCDIPKELQERFHISILPLLVTIDETTYRDGIEVQLDDVYKAMRDGKMPGTAQIRWEDTKALFTSIAEAGDDFIYLAFSAAMSGTFNLANVVCNELLPKYPSCRMGVVDSRGGSIGTGLIALQLGLMNEHGIPFDEMLSQCLWMTAHVRYAFTINDLKWALQGGRLPARAVASAGSLLNIKPILDVKNGMLHLNRVVRGTRQSLAGIVDLTVQYASNFGNQIIGMAYADDREKAETAKQLLEKSLPKCTILCQRIGSVLGSHLGIGGVGIFCMDQQPDSYYRL